MGRDHDSEESVLSRRAVLRGGGKLVAGLHLGALAGACLEPRRPGAAADEEPSQDDALFGPVMDGGEIVVARGPWLSVAGPGQMRLCFETRIETALPVVLTGPSSQRRLEPTLSSQELSFSRQSYDNPEVRSDYPGTHVLQEVVFDDLVAGATYHWAVETGEESITGSFIADDLGASGFRFAWMADSMYPVDVGVVNALAPSAPRLLLHGGDFEYSSSRTDTWSGQFDVLAPLLQLGPMHVAIGNHEFESGNEVEEMYERLFGRQGEDGGARYHSMVYCGVLFICLDSETDSLSRVDTEQYAWLVATLEASETMDVSATVVYFHRPLFTLTHHYVSSTATRDVLLPLFVAHGVRLVLCGHAHCFEHYVFDGVHFVVDGGAGASLYDPQLMVATAESARPELISGRMHAIRGHGGLIVEVAGDALTLRRYDATSGELQYETKLS